MQISRGNSALTLQEIQLAAPSAFAIEPHHSRSSRYSFVPSSEVINGLLRAGFECYKATEARVRRQDRNGFQTHLLRFRHPSTSVVNVGDTFPEVILKNSSDGSSLYELLAGLFRLACSNGLIVSEQEFGSLKIRHTGDVIREVVDGSHAVLEGSKQALTAVRDWSALQLESGEQKAFAEAAHALRFAETDGTVDTPFTPKQLLAPRRREDVGNSLWLTFQRIQENATKGGLHAVELRNGRRRSVTSRAVNGIDGDVKLNRSLWTLATKLAEYKQGSGKASVAGSGK